MPPFPCPSRSTFFTLQLKHLFLVTKLQFCFSQFFFTMCFHNMHHAHFVWKAITSSLMLKPMGNNSVLASLHALCCNSPATFQNALKHSKEAASSHRRSYLFKAKPIPTCTLRSGGTEGETLFEEVVVCSFLCHGETFAVPSKDWSPVTCLVTNCTYEEIFSTHINTQR